MASKARLSFPLIKTATSPPEERAVQTKLQTILTTSEIDRLSRAFFVRSGMGPRELRTLRDIANEVGIQCNHVDSELIEIIDSRNDSGGRLTVGEYLAVFDQLKREHRRQLSSVNREIAEAFVSVGGDDDLGGAVSADLLKQRFHDFQININIDEMLDEIDEDGSGAVEFDEFENLMVQLSSEGGSAVDLASLFVAFGGDPNDTTSTISVHRVLTHYDTLVLPERERIPILRELLTLHENGPQTINFDSFLDIFGGIEECTPQASSPASPTIGDTQPVRKIDSTRLKRFSVTVFQWALERSRHSQELDPSEAMQAKLQRIARAHAMRTNSDEFPIELKHLLKLDREKLANGAQRNRTANPRLWGVVDKAASFLLRFAHLSEIAAHRSKPKVLPPPPKPTRRQYFPPRSTAIAPTPPRAKTKTAPKTPSRWKQKQNDDDLVRSIFRAGKRRNPL